MGFLGMTIPVDLCGGMGDFRFNQVISEEVLAAGVIACCLGLTLQNDICLPQYSHVLHARTIQALATGNCVRAS